MNLSSMPLEARATPEPLGGDVRDIDHSVKLMV
jgi:hypothetical protein